MSASKCLRSKCTVACPNIKRRPLSVHVNCYIGTFLAMAGPMRFMIPMAMVTTLLGGDLIVYNGSVLGDGVD